MSVKDAVLKEKDRHSERVGKSEKMKTVDDEPPERGFLFQF